MKQIKLLGFFLNLLSSMSVYPQKKIIIQFPKCQLVPVQISKVKVEGETCRRIDVSIQTNFLMLKVDKEFLFHFLTEKTKSLIITKP